jgi:hypothetical protein
MPEAKAAVERMVAGDDVVIDVPVLEDATLFEREMRELGIRAVKEVSAAADG